jgi:hypothetical protein
MHKLMQITLPDNQSTRKTFALPISKTVEYIRHHSGPGIYAVFHLEITENPEHSVELHVVKPDFADLDSYQWIEVQSNLLNAVEDFVQTQITQSHYLPGLIIKISNIKTHPVDTSPWHFGVALKQTLTETFTAN